MQHKYWDRYRSRPLLHLPIPCSWRKRTHNNPSFSLSVPVIRYTTENKETCARYVTGWYAVYVSAAVKLFLMGPECVNYISLFLDSSSSAPRMHFAPTTPQASVVTAGLASMETDTTVYLRVRVAPEPIEMHVILFCLSYLIVLRVTPVLPPPPTRCPATC